MNPPLRIGMIGLGTVGIGAARILLDHPRRTELRAGRPLLIQRVAVRDKSRSRAVAIDPEKISTDALSVATADDVDVVVELIGGIEPARRIVEAALEAGKDVVTANKALLCAEGDSLFHKARQQGCCIAFEAAVAGGCPIIAALGQSMSGNQITSMEAIINGTSNFILTEMLHRDVAYADAVKKAQEMGYAEANPAMDVDGTDAAQKLGLLTQLTFGTRVSPDQFPVQGIDSLDLADLKYAHELGYAVKLLATAKLVDGHLEMHTQPTLIRHERPLAQVDGPYNLVAITGDAVGKAWFSAMGAGQMATASAVVADLIDIAVGRAQLTFHRLDLWGEHPPFPLQPTERIQRRYYFRFTVADRPRVIAEIADVLGRNQISLSSIIQHEAPEPDEVADTAAGAVPTVPLVFMTHRTTEGDIRRSARELAELDCMRDRWVCLPVADESHAT